MGSGRYAAFGIAVALVAACGDDGATSEGEDTTGGAADTSSGGPATTMTTAPEDSSSSDGGSTAGTTASETEGATTRTTFVDDPMPCVPDGEPQLLFGHGVKEFSPLEEGPAQLWHGPQGGFHITIGIRSPGIDTANFGTVHFHAEVEGEVVADEPSVVVFNCYEDEGYAEAIWVNVVMESTPEELHGRLAEVDVELEDYAGTMVSGYFEVMIFDPLLEEGTGSGSGSGGSGGSTDGGASTGDESGTTGDAGTTGGTAG